MPEGPFIAITPGKLRALATNTTTYNHTNARTVTRSTEFDIQVDCYGPDSADWAVIITTMFRDPYGYDTLSPECTPLYATDPVQMPLTNAEDNYEQRWSFSALLQFNPAVSVSQEFADALRVTLVNVDATFPPT